MVSWIQQSEPELTAQRGDCLTGVTSAPVDAVLVDPSSTSTSLQLCARSQSGNVWKLTASAAGVQQLLDGTLEPLTMSGNEITDATRAANTQGDGLSNDSSTGIWEATTNLITNGGVETGTSGWVANNAATIARVTGQAKFGSASLKVTPGSGGRDGAQFSVGVALSGSTTYTISAWVWGSGKVMFDILGDGAEQFSSYYTLGSTPTRITYTWTTQSGTTGITPSIVNANVVQSSPYWIDGVQVEQKAYATPYVETDGATASRNAARVQAPASFLSATQGWVAVRVKMGVSESALTGVHPFFSWGNPAVSGYELRGGSGGVDFIAPAYGDLVPASPSWSAGDTLTLIAYWKPTSPTLGLSVNGASFNTGGAGSYASIPQSLFDLGGRYTQNGWADADVLWFAAGTGALTNSDAATINAWGNNDPARSSFPASAQATMVWSGTGSTGPEVAPPCRPSESGKADSGVPQPRANGVPELVGATRERPGTSQLTPA